MTIPTFVINLEEDIKRWRNVSSQINALGLSYSRFDAYRGENIPERWRHQFFPITNSYDPSHSALTKGEIGCYASHLSCMDMLLKGGHPAAMIFEDDIIINSQISDILANLDKLPKNWDIIHLSGHPKSAFISLGNISSEFELIQFSRIPSGTHGYIVSRRGAQKFIFHKRGDVRRVPNDIEVRNAHIRKLNVYGCLPTPVSPISNLPSAIDRVDNGKRKYGTYKSDFKTLIARAIFNINNLTLKLWFKCFLKNVYVHLCRRIRKRNFSLSNLCVKSKI